MHVCAYCNIRVTCVCVYVRKKRHNLNVRVYYNKIKKRGPRLVVRCGVRCRRFRRRRRSVRPFLATVRVKVETTRNLFPPPSRCPWHVCATRVKTGAEKRARKGWRGNNFSFIVNCRVRCDN